MGHRFWVPAPLADRMNLLNHCSRFQLLMTHLTHSMSITSIGGIWSTDLLNRKCVSHVYKVTVALDLLDSSIYIAQCAL